MAQTFPEGFAWGVASAAYQIEGGAQADGKGPSVWDDFTRRPGTIWHGHTGDIACDHYHRFQEDVDLMQALGIGAYRLSLSWPRIFPDGTGAVNPAGLAFYDRLVDKLLEAKITPWVTLFHWDYPSALFHRGGWLNRDSATWFADYVYRVVEALSDRVKHWITLNEPQVFVGLGHLDGIHAPGLRLPWSDILRIGHHALLAHGKAVQAIRAATRQPCRVGLAPVGQVVVPSEQTESAIALARARTFAITERTVWTNSWWLDPVFTGRYPEDGLALFGSDVLKFPAADLEQMKQPLDFFGVNIYTGFFMQEGTDGRARRVEFESDHPITAFNWPVVPEALYWGPRFLHERYGLPVVITENGLSCRDWVSLDGLVHDPQRIDFLTRHLRALHRAIADGVDIRGYFEWSILDNFEWAEGYKERFGLVFVDYATQARIPKDSAHWYSRVIASNGATALAEP